MFIKLLLSIFCISFIYAEDNITILHAHSVDVSYTAPDGKSKKVAVARDTDLRCREIPLNPREYWEGSYANKDVADFCKKTFITTPGDIAPMKMHEDIETYGELEVLEHLEDMQDDTQKLLVDSRKVPWYESISIPGAINIPFEHFTTNNKFEKEKQEALTLFGVKGTKGAYDFSEAKTILLFCNGAWCRQSPQMIEALLGLGYPAKKMKWYRGGMQSWLSLGMTSTRTKP